jgi:sulfide:quinone oxidoreductase
MAPERVRTTILAPDDHLTTHALAVLVPFAGGHVPRAPLERLARDAGAQLHRGRMASVDTDAQRVMTDGGEALPYDALLVAIGGLQRAPYPWGLAFGLPGTEDRMHGLVQDLEGGLVRRVAFVVPPGASWPLPLYELALMAAERAYDQCLQCELTVVTHENAPLAMFGPRASQALAARLGRSGLAVRTGVRADLRGRRLVSLGPDDHLEVDRVVTLPVVDGPAVCGLPHDDRGFLEVDRHGRVHGTWDVYAAGDVTHYPLKHGGLACQQADAAAEAIAARAGADLEPKPYEPMLHSVLITGRAPTFLDSREDATPLGEGTSSWQSVKIAGQELTRHITELQRAQVGER